MINIFCRHNWELRSFDGYGNLHTRYGDFTEYWICRCKKCGKRKIKKLKSEDVVWNSLEQRYVIRR